MRHLMVTSAAAGDTMGLLISQRRLSWRGTRESARRSCMHRQRWLPFEHHEYLDMLWEQFPEPERLKVAKLYGRLIARAAGWKLEHTEKEEGAREHSDE